MGRRTLASDDIVDEPNVRSILPILVAVDLLLLERPFGQRWVLVRPKADLERYMDESKVTRLCHPLLSVVRVVDIDFEERIVKARSDVGHRPGCEFGIGRHER